MLLTQLYTWIEMLSGSSPICTSVVNLGKQNSQNKKLEIGASLELRGGLDEAMEARVEREDGMEERGRP